MVKEECLVYFWKIFTRMLRVKTVDGETGVPNAPLENI